MLWWVAMWILICLASMVMSSQMPHWYRHRFHLSRSSVSVGVVGDLIDASSPASDDDDVTRGCKTVAWDERDDGVEVLLKKRIKVVKQQKLHKYCLTIKVIKNYTFTV